MSKMRYSYGKCVYNTETGYCTEFINRNAPLKSHSHKQLRFTHTRYVLTKNLWRTNPKGNTHSTMIVLTRNARKNITHTVSSLTTITFYYVQIVRPTVVHIYTYKYVHICFVCNT